MTILESKTYESDRPCIKCGSVARYHATNNCANCAREHARNYRKANPDLVREAARDRYYTGKNQDVPVR